MGIGRIGKKFWKVFFNCSTFANMHELRRIKRKELDVERYTQSLNDSLNYRIYAEYWYLDVLTSGKWECWVYGDYEVIMPVPLQFKFGFKFVIQPIYCQQLGVFYKEEISDELFSEFEKRLHKYRVRSYAFNEENTKRYNPKGDIRVNYILDLNRPYEEIFGNYTKHRRKDIRKSEKLGLKIQETSDYNYFVKTKFTNYTHLSKFVNEPFLRKLLAELILNEKLIIKNIFDADDNNIASQIFTISGNRRICFGFVRDKEKERHNSSAYVIDRLINQLSNENLMVDFEGSMNPSIADFMEGFGVEKSHYTYFKRFTVFKFL